MIITSETTMLAIANYQIYRPYYARKYIEKRYPNRSCHVPWLNRSCHSSTAANILMTFQTCILPTRGTPLVRSLRQPQQGHEKGTPGQGLTNHQYLTYVLFHSIKNEKIFFHFPIILLYLFIYLFLYLIIIIIFINYLFIYY